MSIEYLMVNDPNPELPIKRRSVLKGVGGGLLGLTSSSGKINNSLSVDDTIEIVTALQGQTPIETEIVSKSWYDYEQRVDSLWRDLYLEYRDHPAVANIEITPSENNSIGGRNTSMILFFIHPDHSPPDLPDSINEIPIRSTRAGETSPSTHGTGCHGASEFNPVPGGVQMGEGSGGSWGTCAAKVERNGVHYMLHCNHVFGSCESNEGQSVYRNGQYVGYGSKFHSKEYDWLLIKHDGTATSHFQKGVRLSVDKTVHPISGHFTRDGLKVAMEEGRSIYKQGVSSGYTKGTILGIDNAYNPIGYCINLEGYGFRTSNNSAKGDSGGPVFARGKNNPDNLVMAGHHVAWKDNWPLGNPETGCAGSDLHPESINMSAYRIATYNAVYYVTG